MRKVLIIGGAGLLGVNWAIRLRETFSVSIGLHDRHIAIPGIGTVNFSKHDQLELSRYITAYNPDIVINAAGLTSIESCEKNPELAYQVNVDIAHNLAKICSDQSITFVQVSTDNFGYDSPATETDKLLPLNIYGKTKAEAEEKVLSAYPESLVIRTNFYGWGPKYRSSFSDTIVNTLRAGKEINLFKDVYYTPILIEDLVSTVHELINKNASGIYNVSGNERITKHEFGLRLAAQFNLDTQLINATLLSEQKNLVKRPFEMALLNSKVSKLLNRKVGLINKNLLTLKRQEEAGMSKEILQL